MESFISNFCNIFFFIFKCLVHLPGQKIFCPGQNSNCPGQKFCPELKSPFFACKSHLKWNFLIGRALKIYLQLEIFIFNDFWKWKMDFLTLDKILVLDNLNIVPDKKYFVWADEQGIYIENYIISRGSGTFWKCFHALICWYHISQNIL